jgi:hypothetical protein
MSDPLLTFTIPVPRPGEVAAHDLGYLTALIENTGTPADIANAVAEVRIEPLITYEVVDVRGARRTHAAIVRHHELRSVVDRWTLCSRSKSRRVSGRRRDQGLSTVTCKQCLQRLADAGVLKR